MSKNETPHLIQLIEKRRIFAKCLLKKAFSRANFAMLGCYIRRTKKVYEETVYTYGHCLLDGRLDGSKPNW
jgi:hypothetical protein